MTVKNVMMHLGENSEYAAVLMIPHVLGILKSTLEEKIGKKCIRILII